MTVIVGILCSDGVVIASDSAATYSAGAIQTIGQQHVTKIWKIENSVIYAASGAIGIAQLSLNAVEALWKARELSSTKVSTPAEAMARISREMVTRVEGIQRSASVLAPILGAHVAGQSAMCQSLLTMPFKRKAMLVQFYANGAPELATEELPFISIGLGQQIADPFLAFLKRILWKDRQPTTAEGRLVAAWTVKHVAETIPGGVGGPLQMASLSMTA